MHHRHVLRVSLGALLLTVVTQAAFAREKTDIIAIKNGDRVHGEIVSLEYGSLTLKTDSLGTLAIEWPDVVAVESRYTFYVETVGGRRHYGTFVPDAPAGTLVIRSGETSESFLVKDVTRIDQVEQTLIDRINGSFALGFNYTKATDITVTTARFEASYRSERNVASLTTEMNRTNSPDSGESDRLTLGYVHQYLRPHGKFYVGGSSFERNEELGIDGRLQLAGGLGRFLRQTAKSELSIFGGVALNQEWVTGAESQQTVEGVLGSNWRIFSFSHPKTSLTSSFVLFPGLSDWGRVRSNLNVSLRRELFVDDLYFDLSLYHSYDSDPPSETAAKDDYGLVTSLGYSF